MDEKLKKRKGRAIVIGSVAVAGLVLLLFRLPFPYSTVAQGVIWVPETSQVVAGTPGVVREVLVQPGQAVAAGTPLARCDNEGLLTRVRVAELRLEELSARIRLSQSLGKTTESRLLEEEVRRTENEVQELNAQRAGLVIGSPREGVFYPASDASLLGRHLSRGDTLGYVLQSGDYTARVVVPQSQVDRIRGDVRSVSLRLAEAVDEVLPASLVRQVPGAHRELPSLALSVEGGGPFALDPGETRTLASFSPLFQFEVLLRDLPGHRIGERVYVRFTHTPEPLGYRLLRATRRLFLETLSV